MQEPGTGWQQLAQRACDLAVLSNKVLYIRERKQGKAVCEG